MKKTYKLNFIVLFALIFFISGCDKEDFTGYSTLVPTNPTISVSGISPSGYNFVEKDSTFTFAVTLSEAQISNVALYITQIDGDATQGADFKINNPSSKVSIPAYATSGEISISILSDDIAEETETFILQIGDDRTTNATFTPITVTFTIGNATSDVLVAGMSWDTNVLTAVGLDLSPTDAVDMRMLIIDKSDMSIVDVSDGGSFEEYSGFNTLADGEYMIAADIYSTINAGDFNTSLSISLALDFVQDGVIDGVHMDFPAVMTNDYTCDAYRTYLATVTKAGSNYTLEESISYLEPGPIAWYGLDTEFGYPSEVTTVAGCDLLIFGLSYGWMLDFWGEEVIAEGNIVYTIAEDGTITIEDQYAFTTLYDGAEYPYNISGTGVYDESGAFPTMTITYVLDQEGFNPSAWCFDNGYMTVDVFVATLTLDPAGKSVSNVHLNKAVVKNYRK